MGIGVYLVDNGGVVVDHVRAWDMSIPEFPAVPEWVLLTCKLLLDIDNSSQDHTSKISHLAT